MPVLQDSEIEEIAQRVRSELGQSAKSASLSRTPTQPRAYAEDGRCSFNDLDQAIDAARGAQRVLLDLGLAKRFEIIDGIRRSAFGNAERWGQMAVQETGLGRMPDKMIKNVLAARKTPGPEDLRPETFSGDHGLTVVEPAPYGIVGVLTPSTNPSATVVNNAISLISSGNACVFHPHPAAKNVCRSVALALNEAIVAAGGPENVITMISNPTQESAVALMKHRKIDLLLVTGGSEVVRLAMTSGNRAICAGPGNPPVIVDETAEHSRAARDIVFGAGFDNNVLCTDEKAIFAVDKVADALKQGMITSGAFEITGNDIDQLTRLVVAEDKTGKGHRHVRINKSYIGRDLHLILKELDIRPPSGAQIAIMEVNWDHPLVMAEQLMPIIPLVRCRSFEEAMEWAIVAEHGYRHTFVMHSTSITHLSAMAQNCGGNIFVKNGPNLAGLGYGGEGYTTLSIAGTTGEGMTKASTFTRPRRCTLVDSFRIV